MLKGICQVSFIKVKDGANRTIYCTLDFGLIPKQYEQSVENIFSKEPNDIDIVPIWDIVENKWKSFRISKINFFLTSDELIDENKVGHNTKNKLVEIMKKRKQDSIDNFNQRIEKLKNEAKESKEKLNKKTNKNPFSED